MTRAARILVSTVLLTACWRSPAVAQPADLDPRIVKIVSSVSEERLGAILKKLESFETRSTMSSTDSATRGVGAARNWILQEMQSYSPRLKVEFDAYQVPPQGARITRPVDLRNVMAVLPGRSPRRIYISGHYDTLARPGGQGASNSGADTTTLTAPPADPNAPLDNFAPGVNDDGSGTALTIELARVFSQSGVEFEATLVFMGETAEILARQYGITRDESDCFALQSQKKAAAAITAGYFRREISPVTVAVKGKPTVVDQDEHPRFDASIDSLRKLPTVFNDVEGQPGIITAGSSSGVTDGGAALVLTSSAVANRRGLKPRARILGWASAGVDPRVMQVMGLAWLAMTAGLLWAIAMRQSPATTASAVQR